MTKKYLHILLTFDNLIISKLLSSNQRMSNFVIKFMRIHEICKKFVRDRVNKHSNESHCGIVPIFSDLEVISLSLTAEVFSFNSENYLFKLLEDLNFVSGRQFNMRCKLTTCLAEDICMDTVKSIDAGEGVFVIACKPHAVCKISAVIHSYYITAANVYDIHYLEDVK